MVEQTRHLVIDANVLSAFLYGASTNAKNVSERSRILLNAALQANWSGVRLYTPSICIAEAMGVLDKYRFCKWHGAVRKDNGLRLSSVDHAKSRDQLLRAVKERIIEQLSHDSDHVMLAGLVSPINNHYKIRTGKKVKPPMGAADCLIAGMTIHLINRLGKDSVMLVTADQRLADVLNRARKISESSAQRLGLVDVATQTGLQWNTDLYPSCINLSKASEAELREAFGGWPLPNNPLQRKTQSELTEGEKQSLLESWMTVATRHRMTNPDRLPYAAALQEIRCEFAVRTSVNLASDDVYWFLINMRKAGKLPRPTTC